MHGSRSRHVDHTDTNIVWYYVLMFMIAQQLICQGNIFSILSAKLKNISRPLLLVNTGLNIYLDTKQ